VQNPQARLARIRDRLAHAGQRLLRGFAHNAGRRARAFAPLAARLDARLLRPRFARASDRLERFGDRLKAAAEGRWRQESARLAALGPRLENLSHRRALARGFALVRDAERRILSSRAAVPPGAALAIEFADGEVAARAEGEGSVSRHRRREGGGQGDLF
jgi:exodeoxyribonuclease VII large subunit